MTLDASELAVARQRLAFPLDYPTLQDARAGADRVKDSMGVLKVGLELFVAEGPAAVALGRELDMAVFLDLKLHDIPATVERAVGSACQLGARYLTLHAAGGPRMLEAAASRVTKENTDLCLLAVTVLTSLDASDLRRVGVSADPTAQAERLGKLAVECGVGGLVCSPAEVAKLRSELGPLPVLVTPGIRPAGSDVGDQKRVGTPTEAIHDGSSLLVVGRPVRDAIDPRAAAHALATEVAEALGTEVQ